MKDVGLMVQDRQEISEGIYRYCRSLDRMDRELMSTVFHPSGTVQYPKFQGTWMEFVDWVWGLHRAFESHSHQISNILIRFGEGGSSAVSESYVTATLWKPANDSPTLPLAEAPDGAGGAQAQTKGTKVGVWARYLDQWSRSDDGWAIDHRECVVDMKTETDAVGLVGTGRRDRADPSYALLEETPGLRVRMQGAQR